MVSLKLKIPSLKKLDLFQISDLFCHDFNIMEYYACRKPLCQESLLHRRQLPASFSIRNGVDSWIYFLPVYLMHLLCFGDLQKTALCHHIAGHVFTPSLDSIIS